MPKPDNSQNNWQKSYNVHNAMINQTGFGNKISAGVRAAFNSKFQSLYSNDTTKASKVLRIFGEDNLATWIDRFFLKKHKEHKNPNNNGDNDVIITKKIVSSLSKINGFLKVQYKEINAIHNLLGVVASDVSNIKTTISPRVMKVKSNGEETEALYDPLGPEGNKFTNLTASKEHGIPVKLKKKFELSAIKKTVYETTKLALKDERKEEERINRSRSEYKDQEEKYIKRDSPTKTYVDEEKTSNKKEKSTDGKKSIFESLLQGFGTFKLLQKVLPILSRFISAGGLTTLATGLSLWGGFKIGTKLNEKFNLDTKINDALDKLGITKGSKAAKKNSIQDVNKILEATNKKLRGTGWKALGKGLWKRNEDGAIFKTENLPDEAKSLFKASGIASFQSFISIEQRRRDALKLDAPIPEENMGKAETNRVIVSPGKDSRHGIINRTPSTITKEIVEDSLKDDISLGEKKSTITNSSTPTMESEKITVSPGKDSRHGIINRTPTTIDSETGSLSVVKPLSNKDLLDVISEGEGTSDEMAKTKGYESGYDVTLGFGKFNKATKKPLSKMTLNEVRTLQDEILKNSGNLNSSAVGKYQIVRSTLFGGKSGWGGLAAQMGLKPTDIFSPELQDRLAMTIIKQSGLDRYKSNTMSLIDFQKNLSTQWDSIENPYTNKTGTGNKPATKSSKIQPVLSALGPQIDQNSRMLMASNSPNTNVAMINPVINKINNSKQTPIAHRSMAKADVFTRENSFLRASMRDTKHPLSLG